MSKPKVLILVILAAGAAAFFGLDLGQYFSLDFIKQSQQSFAAQFAANPWRITAIYFALYVAVTALSLPGAAILTLAGGAAFGLVWGTVVVSCASTLGATLAMLAARYVLRDSIEARFGAKLADIHKGIAKEGAFYLFTLRLIPVLPFFAVNLLMGLTQMRTWTYFWVSQLGMFAGTVAYVNAGTEIAKIESLRSILSPGLLGSFAVLGLLPLLVKKSLDGWRSRQVYARWKGQRPKTFDRNLIVIGAGAAGLVTAYIAAAVKAKVTLIEAHKLGGDCLNTGCVPSKALIRSAKLAHQMRHADRFGLLATEPRLDFKALMKRVQQVVRSIEPHDSVERYTQLGVDVVQGHAQLINPWTVEIKAADGNLRRLTARAIVLATGAAPVVPPLPGLAEMGVLTSDTLWDRLAQLDAPPRRMVVLGGGPIGCELAQAMARLGSAVTQVEMADRVLSREDTEVSQFAAETLRADGVTLLLGHQALRCEWAADGDKQLVVSHQGTEQHIAFDELICAVGRAARLSGYGLEDLGIPTQRTISTNEALQTLLPNIYAAGDVVGPYQFTHAAAHQAWYAAVNALFGQFKRFRVDYRVIPAVTFIDPEVARVGLNELEAKAKNIAYEVTRYGLDDLDRAIADSEAHGWIKVLTTPDKDQILGVTIVGSHAGELLAEYVLAMKHGLGLNKVLGTIHTYPTFSEANKYAAGEWKRAHQPKALLAWVEKYHTWRRR